MTKKLTLLNLLFLSFFLILACNKDDDDEHNEEHSTTEYQALINTPSAEDKKVNDLIHIHVDFSSATNETIHHVNVRIYNKANNTEIYSKPDVAHVHQEDGLFEFHDDFTLSEENGVAAHTDWVLEAKIWGHESGLGEVIEMLEFHVHPE